MRLLAQYEHQMNLYKYMYYIRNDRLHPDWQMPNFVRLNHRIYTDNLRSMDRNKGKYVRVLQ